MTTAELLSQLELILVWYQRMVNPQTGMLEYLYIPEDNRFVRENCPHPRHCVRCGTWK